MTENIVHLCLESNYSIITQFKAGIELIIEKLHFLL